MTYQLTTLDNGLRVASETLPGIESVAVAVTIGVGSRFEGEHEGGLSHILEHMAFKGTASRSAQAIAEAFEDIGGQFNAYTSVENTVYFARVLKSHFREALALLADILQYSKLDAEELAREQQVIVQEIGMHMDTPEDYITDLFDAAAYPNQPIGRSILGTEAQVRGYTRDEVAGYMAKHYQPSRMVISAAGNLTHAALMEGVTETFHMPKGAAAGEPERATYHGGEVTLARPLEQTHILLGYAGLPLAHADYYALQLLSNILGGGMSSRLFQEIREKRGLVYHIGSHMTSYTDTGVLAIYAATAPDDAPGLPLLMTDELKKMTDGVTDAELARAKIQLTSELAMARESSSAVSGWIGRHLLTYGEYLTLPTLMQRIEAVTRADIPRLAGQLLQGTPTLARLGG